MRHEIKVTVNGEAREDEIDPRLLLVQYLRDVLSLTGTHIACETSQCGACTVLLDGKAVKACTMLAVQADGRSVTTIEGLGRDGELHPVQRAFWQEFGLQCGFCTPGFIMATTSLLAETTDVGEEDIRHGLAGNLCRCTGYVNIIRAVRAAARAMAHHLSETRGDAE